MPTSSCCWRGGSAAVVGRIAAIDDRLHDEAHGDNTRGVRVLRGRGRAWRRKRCSARRSVGARSAAAPHVRGPLNPSLNESAGLLIDGFDTDPMLMMPHNPPEYAGYHRGGRLPEGEGPLRVAVRPRAASSTRPSRSWPTRVRGPVAHRRAAVWSCASSSARSQRLRVLYCGAWARNWGFVPPTADGVPPHRRRAEADLRSAMRRVRRDRRPRRRVRRRRSRHQPGAARARTAGCFRWASSGCCGRKTIIDQVRLLLLGVLPEYRAIGLFPLLICELQAAHRDQPALSPRRVLLGARRQSRHQSSRSSASARASTRPIASIRKR